jgi:cytoskeletal protein RodZ
MESALFVDKKRLKMMNQLKSEKGLLILVLALVGAVAVVIWIAHRL